MYYDSNYYSHHSTSTGVLNEYDCAKSDIDSVNRKLNDYLKKQRKRLGVQVRSFFYFDLLPLFLLLLSM